MISWLPGIPYAKRASTKEVCVRGSVRKRRRSSTGVVSATFVPFDQSLIIHGIAASLFSSSTTFGSTAIPYLIHALLWDLLSSSCGPGLPPANHISDLPGNWASAVCLMKHRPYRWCSLILSHGFHCPKGNRISSIFAVRQFSVPKRSVEDALEALATDFHSVELNMWLTQVVRGLSDVMTVYVGWSQSES